MKLAVHHADGCSTNLGIIGAECNCGARFQAGEDQKMLNRALKLVRSVDDALFDVTLRELFREIEGHKRQKVYVLTATEFENLRQKYLRKGVRK